MSFVYFHFQSNITKPTSNKQVNNGYYPFPYLDIRHNIKEVLLNSAQAGSRNKWNSYKSMGFTKESLLVFLIFRLNYFVPASLRWWQMVADEVVLLRFLITENFKIHKGGQLLLKFNNYQLSQSFFHLNSFPLLPPIKQPSQLFSSK